MSIYYTVGCKTCKEKLSMAGYTDESICKIVGHFAFYYHKNCEVVIVDDIIGWCDEHDNFIHEVDSFKDSPLNIEDVFDEIGG